MRTAASSWPAAAAFGAAFDAALDAALDAVRGGSAAARRMRADSSPRPANSSRLARPASWAVATTTAKKTERVNRSGDRMFILPKVIAR